MPKMSAAEASFDIARKYSSSSVQLKTLNEQDTSKNALAMDTKQPREPSRSISESSLSIASSTTSSSDTSKTDSSLRLRNATRKVNRSRSSTIGGASVAGGGEDNSFDVDEQKLEKDTNIAFIQLG